MNVDARPAAPASPPATPRFVDVAVKVPSGRGLPVYSYQVPDGLDLDVGHLVAVPFGNRIEQGVVVAVNATPAVTEIREVQRLLDPVPVVTAVHVRLARWIADRYHCSLFDALQLALPPGVRQRTVTWVETALDDFAAHDLSPTARTILEILGPKGRQPLSRLRDRLRQHGVTRGAPTAIGQLVRRGLLRRYTALAPPTVRPRFETFVQIQAEPSELRQLIAESARAPVRRAALEKLAQLADADRIYPTAVLREVHGITTSVLTPLVRRGVVEIVRREVQRDPLADQPDRPVPANPLTPPQRRVFDHLVAALFAPNGSRRRPVLLRGVTSSGKTDLYLALLERVIAEGGQGIVLVPEIALTPQMVQRFVGRFPGRVTVLHSRLTPGEHFDAWRRIRTGEVAIVIGSRSALFAPLPALRLIVVDEEHEPSYKQEATPRYHARDAAVKLGELADVLTVLGSATPEVASYHRAQRGEWDLVELEERIGVLQPADTRAGTPAVIQRGRALPRVQVVDMRAELRAGNRGIFSRALVAATSDALARGDQVILYLNRRGSATFVMCRDCGHVLRCRRCDVPLSYHADPDRMVCHLCNLHDQVPPACPSCWSTRVKYFGIGTQRVAEEAARVFPNARIMRWDRDAARGRRAHDELLGKFLRQEANVLVGTQMIAKGLDLPGVTLVGVVSADTTLHLPHYRAVERTFQLLTQVAGRAGRGAEPGAVILQTYTPDHYCIQAALRHDYRGFYEREIAFRREQRYPPFSQIARLVYTGSPERRVWQEAARVARLLRQEVARAGVAETSVLGPAPAFHQRLRGRYRWQLILKAPDHGAIHAVLAEANLPPGWMVDVDPVSLW